MSRNRGGAVFLLLSCLCFFTTFTSAAYYIQLANGDKVNSDPGWQPRANYKTPKNPLDAVKYYGCTKARKATLQAGMADQALASAQLRDILKDSGRDKKTFAMLDYLFRNAFALSSRKKARTYRMRVRDRFDLMSKGLALNPQDPTQVAPVRVICLNQAETDGTLDAQFAAYNMHDGSEEKKAIAAWAYEDRAQLVMFHNFWWRKNTMNYNMLFVCAGGRSTKSSYTARVVSHELSHLALVHYKATFPEFYQHSSDVDIRKVTPEMAIENNDMYAAAVEGHIARCAELNWPDDDDYFGELRRLKSAEDDDSLPPMPEAELSNTTYWTFGKNTSHEFIEPDFSPDAIRKVLEL